MEAHKIIAHRGMSTLAPENTMAAFELMPRYGIDWLETDIAITKDEELVIMHDNDVAGTTDGVGKVTAMNFNEIQKLSAGKWFDEQYQNEKVPTFDQLITFINDNNINVNLEIKSITGNDSRRLTESMVQQLASKIDQIDANNRVIVSSFYPEILLKLKRIRPDLEYACLFNNLTINLWRPIVKLLDSKIVHLANRNLSAKQVQKIKNAGLEINVWTVDRIDRANQLFNWGVDGIFTDIGQDFPHHRGNSERDGHFLTTWF